MIIIPLTQGQVTFINDEDEELVSQYTWCASTHSKSNIYYATSNLLKITGIGKSISMHRLILGAKPGQVVDHKDGDGLNNQRYNIRICTVQQNVWNSAKMTHYKGKKPTSRYRGVRLDKRSNRWEARIRADGKYIYLGCFGSEIEAGAAYHTAVLQLRGTEWTRSDEVPLNG